MHFDVGSNTYRLRVTEGPIRVDGAECLSACVQADKQILISKEARRDDRMRLLLRELARAWTFETGQPRSEDGWLDLSATVTLAAIKNLNVQGGELAVLSIDPGETVDASTVKIGLSTNRYCPCCQETVAGGSVEWAPVLPGVVEVAIYCHFCGDTWRWREAQSTRGLLTAIVLGPPTKERGEKTRNRIGERC